MHRPAALPNARHLPRYPSGRNVIRAQLAHNIVLKEMDESEREELERDLEIVDCAKGESLLDQGVHEMQQYFVLDGILKRVVTNAPVTR